MTTPTTKGKRIRTLEQLELAALDRKAVSSGVCFRRTPAAFVISMPAIQVLRLLRSGMFIYKPKGQPRTRREASDEVTP